MAEERLTQEATEWFISIFGEDDHQQPDPEAKSKHRIPKALAKFREYKQDKLYFDPQVVSLGPYHHGKGDLKPMEKHKITVAKQFVEELKDRTVGRGRIYEEFMKVIGVAKGCYAAEVVAHLTDDDFARMMFLDGCFVLHFIDNQLPFGGGQKTKLEISNDVIPLIIRDMFLMENQLPFEVLDALMNLRRDSSSSGTISLGKLSIVKFVAWKVLKPMGFYSLNSHRLWKWCAAVDGVEQYDSPLHLLDILRTILLDFPPSKGSKKHSYKASCFGSVTELEETRIISPDSPTSNGAEKKSDRPHNFGSVMELKEIGIRFKKRRMKSLMDISYKENLFFPRLLLPTMFINDTTISQLLNLTAFEACSDTYSGCGVTSFIHFMDSLINDGADVKKLRSKGILHHSLGSDDEVARLFNTWPANVTNDLKLYSDIRKRIHSHRDRRVKISIATWWDKYFRSPWTAISFVAAVLLLFFTAVQTYFAAFSGR